MRHGLILLIVAATIGVLVEAADPEARTARKSTGRLDVTVESRLVKSNLPADPLIKFFFSRPVGRDSRACWIPIRFGLSTGLKGRGVGPLRWVPGSVTVIPDGFDG
ncbi:MAG: hypothetical protein CM1200mP2_38400 [Planctomycetaceae bacterium]|nr:MAG: hypothetical protein CM1200mP2_38400 [Planctomycetaceae bacterium]